MHYIRRVVAVEGDRVAVRAGRAVVNGMPVEEPYIDIGDPNAAVNNMPETRVLAGQLFVLCDSRAHGTDSRQTATHGFVPVTNVIARVTDVAFSRVVTRMGRWIGTPSKL
jgi:signal peptidase I